MWVAVLMLLCFTGMSCFHVDFGWHSCVFLSISGVIFYLGSIQPESWPAPGVCLKKIGFTTLSILLYRTVSEFLPFQLPNRNLCVLARFEESKLICALRVWRVKLISTLERRTDHWRNHPVYCVNHLLNPWRTAHDHWFQASMPISLFASSLFASF